METNLSKEISKELTVKNPLWTRDFTIITIGSVVSMLGNSMAGFAMSLMVLDFTGSTMLYAIYLMTYTVPQLLVPIFSVLANYIHSHHAVLPQ